MALKNGARHAGDAGRGFAVVASEVKALAEQTAKATEEIGAHISEIQNSTQQTVVSIGDVSSSVADIQELISNIGQSVEQQKVATEEIAHSVASANDGTETVLNSVRSVSGSLDMTVGEANRVGEAAEVLSSATEKMTHDVEHFIEKISEDVVQRRSALRMALSATVVVSAAGDRQNANFIDISETGARLTNVSQCPIGSAITLELSNGESVKAKIVRHTEDGCGVQFFEPLKDVDKLVLQAA